MAIKNNFIAINLPQFLVLLLLIQWNFLFHGITKFTDYFFRTSCLDLDITLLLFFINTPGSRHLVNAIFLYRQHTTYW